jgi:hypothetical protein
MYAYRQAGHAFVSYSRGDAAGADALEEALRAAGVRIWRDTADLWPGDDWRARIREAVSGDALVFLACLSSSRLAALRSRQHEELSLAIDELRQRNPQVPWLIPVRFDECEIPDLDIGGGKTLRSLESADLFGDGQAKELARLVTAVIQILSHEEADPPSSPPSSTISERSALASARSYEDDFWLLSSNSAVADAKRELADQLRISEPLKGDLRPMPIRWEPVEAGHARFAGEFEKIYDVFRATGSCRLVILGAAGAGKSELARKLTRDLLTDPRSYGKLFPVWLDATTWAARSDVQSASPDMAEWITRELRRYPVLATSVRDAAGGSIPLAEAFVRDGVLPVIDGLDELAEPRRFGLIEQIADWHHPLVLTSREEEFYAATSSSGLDSAVTIRLCPLDAQQVRAYLKPLPSTAAGRWQEVFAELGTEPDGPLARTLSTPLMLWLAAKVYRGTRKTPRELVERSHFPGETDIGRHLLAGLVPEIYPRKRGLRRGTRYNSAQALRWLRFLAAHLERTDTADITWWRLPHLAGYGGRSPAAPSRACGSA